MTRELTVSIDAMGGDAGPGIVVAALMRSIQRHTEVRYLLHGDEAILTPLLARHPKLKGRVAINHAPARVAMEDKPSHVLRRGRDTSMWHTIASVEAGEAQVAVSAGNTGALMAVAMFQLGTVEGIARPAIASIWPTLRGQSIVLDCGANVSTSAEQLVDFAVMGEAFAHAILGPYRGLGALHGISPRHVGCKPGRPSGFRPPAAVGLSGMSDPLPFSEIYNLSRLGAAGDEVTFMADAATCDAIARWSDVPSVPRFKVVARLKKLSPTRFQLEEDLDVDVVQSCVATLAPVPAHMARSFIRELHFTGPARHRPGGDEPPPDVVMVLGGPDEAEPPEDITSLHYDLAGPALEEYVLGLEPYPRAPGAQFEAPEPPQDPEESPFAVLKRLKSDG